MAAIQDFDYVPGTVDGIACWLKTTLATGCNAQSGMVSSTEIVYSLPDSVEGYQWKTRECAPVQDDDIVVTSDPADFVDPNNPVDPTNPTDPGSSDPNAETDAQIYTSSSGNDGGNL